MTFGILFSKWFGFKARGLWNTWHRLLIFWKYSKDKKKRLKTSLTLSLILWFNLRLGGYSIWSAIIHRTPYKRKNSGHEHLIASRRVLEERFQDGASKEVEDCFRSTRRACSTQLRRARGLVRPGATGLRTSRSPYWAKGIGRVLYLIYVVFYPHAE
jgi:hypothetical protein